MSMLLTLSQPTRTDFGSRAHDFCPRIPIPKPRLSPPSLPSRVDSLVNSLPVSVPEDNMSTAHRGLPPPSAMTMMDPSRPPPLSQSLASMPAPPNQWHGHEESMRNWLLAKAEEDKRKQEEEKTRQESYRLEQRRIEQSMLRESLQAGIPPSMVPMIYAGIGGANLTNVSIDLLQQYAGQLQAQQQSLQQSLSPDIRREPRQISLPQNTYPAAAQQNQPQVVTSQPAPGENLPPPIPLSQTYSGYQAPNSRSSGPTSVPRSATHTQLPRLTTNEIYVHQQPQIAPGGAQQQQTRIIQDAQTSSPSIYFHHWVPPNESKSTQPQTPASKGESHSAHPGSHLSESDYRDSPRKRKATGGHQPNPPPSAGLQYTSPSFSTISSTSARKNGARRRSPSIASARDSDSRPESRRGVDPQRSQPDSGQLSEDRTGASSTEAQRDHPYTEEPNLRRT